MAEDRSRISTSRLSSSEVARASFTIVRRGFDPEEVRGFLDQVARELEALSAREADLRKVASAPPAPTPLPVLDEASLTAQLGHKSAEVLRAAHDEARAVLEAAQARANELLNAAQAKSSELAIEAEQKAAARVGDAEVAASSYEAEALEAAKKVVAKGRADAETLVARARQQGRAMIDQAQEARSRVLGDMNERRRMMHVQIEQLRAARDHLAQSVIGVRNTIDALTSQIASTDEAARAAAEEVARRQPSLGEMDLPPFEVTFDEGLGVVAGDATAEQGGQADLVDTAAPATGKVLAVRPNDDDALAPEPGVVEELFAKIRASAHDEPSEKGATAAPSAPSGPDAQLLGARDAALSAPRSTLARKVKRTLQDEQNRLLDVIRAGKDVAAILLDDERALQTVIAAAAVDPIRDAAHAGRNFAADRGISSPSKLSDAAVMALAEALAGQIATPVRRRLEAAGTSEDPVAEVSAAFREWRGSRLDRVIGDVSLDAFSAAVVAASGSGAIRWVASGSPNPCPDCADNALEGAVSAGATFPTGQSHPPAHAGCRCAVVPVLG